MIFKTVLKNLKKSIVVTKSLVVLTGDVNFTETSCANMSFYSSSLCKKIARAPGGHKKFMLTKLGRGEQNSSEKVYIQINVWGCITLGLKTKEKV